MKCLKMSYYRQKFVFLEIKLTAIEILLIELLANISRYFNIDELPGQVVY